MTLCVIPARGGSKGVPRKNLLDVGGKPLIVWTIEQALAVPDLDVLPVRYPQLRHCDFRAGLELRCMHFGLLIAAAAVRFSTPSLE